jgi:hypothetical protein
VRLWSETSNWIAVRYQIFAVGHKAGSPNGSDHLADSADFLSAPIRNLVVDHRSFCATR